MASKKHVFDLEKCARPNILRLKPYRCARDDYKDDGNNILLDANENAYGPGLDFTKMSSHVNGSSIKPEVDFLGLNRYPDPHQEELKTKFCKLRNQNVCTTKQLKPENMFCGVGSDEAIDTLLRCFCSPGKDKILTCPPTYGMYQVSADVNDIQIVKVPLNVEDGFSLQAEKVCDVLSSDSSIKLVYFCSPGNPTASLIRKDDLQQILEHPSWNGIVVLDEAYIDFAASGSSLAQWVLEWPNLVVMQTLSKAFGLAGIRLGVAFSSPEIATLMNNMKAPYNISSPTSALASTALEEKNIKVMYENRNNIIEQRKRLMNDLPQVPGIGRFLGGSDSNFLLVEILDRPREEDGRPDNATALAVYETMAGQRGVVARFRGKEVGCTGCLRITVGTEKEVDIFLKEIRSVLQQIYSHATKVSKVNGEARQHEAAAVIS